MDRLKETETAFVCREVPLPDLSQEKVFPKGIRTKILFDEDVKWRLVEEFGPDCFMRNEDGRLLFESNEMDMENLCSWIMTFGSRAEVLEPQELRDLLRDNAEKLLKIYGKE